MFQLVNSPLDVGGCDFHLSRSHNLHYIGAYVDVVAVGETSL